jgi:hypothetical protein
MRNVGLPFYLGNALESDHVASLMWVGMAGERTEAVRAWSG